MFYPLELRFLFFFFDHSEVFTCFKVINPILGPTLLRKPVNLILPNLSSQNMGGFHHAAILFPWHNDPLLSLEYEETRVADYESRCFRKRD